MNICDLICVWCLRYHNTTTIHVFVYHGPIVCSFKKEQDSFRIKSKTLWQSKIAQTDLMIELFNVTIFQKMLIKWHLHIKVYEYNILHISYTQFLEWYPYCTLMVRHNTTFMEKATVMLHVAVLWNPGLELLESIHLAWIQIQVMILSNLVFESYQPSKIIPWLSDGQKEILYANNGHHDA